MVAQLLHKNRLISTFVESGNLHGRVGDSKSTLDFKVGSIFFEYPPLSIQDKAEGLTIEEAGDRKRGRINRDKCTGHTVIHIWKLKQLYQLLAENPEIHRLMKPEYRKVTGEAFLTDLREAKAYGHEVDRGVTKAQALPVDDRSHYTLAV